MKVLYFIGLFLAIASCAPASVPINDFGLEKTELKSGFEFLTTESQILQNDDFANPGLLWVDKGQYNFDQYGCNECHSDTDFSKTANGFPKIHKTTRKLTNLQGQINYCRSERQSATALEYESEDMLGLVTFIKNKGLGETLTFKVTPEIRPHFDAGKHYYFARRGQLNLSCAQCHDDHWGAKMRGDTVSQGHINGFPAFRNDWQTLGSSHRRFQACNTAIRAEMSELGSKEYIELEIYLLARGNSLKNETPAIRR